MSKKMPHKKEPAVSEGKSFLNKLDTKRGLYLSGGLLALLLAVVFSASLFLGLSPGGEDTLASVGASNLYLEWQKESGETALWNPAVFGGMPVYPRITPRLLQVDTTISYLSRLIDWAFLYFLIGGVGLMLLLVYKKIPWYAALIVVVAFVLLPDWQALVGTGHNAKLRAVMVIPWLILSFNYFFDKKNWLSVGFFALIFSWLVRTQHFQIVFYGIMLLFFLFIIPFVKLFIEKKSKEGFSLLGKFVLAVVLTIITSAQPFLSLKEYAPHSTRGGNAITLGEEEQTAKKSGGVSFDYATQWSQAPAEIADFFIARFHGGYSQEIYEGDKYPQLKGRLFLGYWGEKPFNGNYAFLGMILFLFAIFGVQKYRKDSFVAALAVFTVFSILLSFGRHFPQLYELFFYYMPYFSKFRAPAMIVNISFISILVLAGYGIKALIVDYKEDNLKTVMGIFGGGILFAAIIFLTKNSFSFSNPGDARYYDANSIAAIKDIRLEILTADLIRLLLLLVATTVTVFAFIRKKISSTLLVVLLLVFVIAETIPVTLMAKGKIQMNDKEQLKAGVFRQTEISKFLQSRPEGSRAISLGREFQSNHYAYFYPIINGYSAIKTQLIQDIIQNNIFNAQTEQKINWNVINMLGGRYIIASGQIGENFLQMSAHEKSTGEIIYTNNNALPKGWFVKKVKYFDNERDLVEYMNTVKFTPDTEVLTTDKSISVNDTLTAAGNIELVKTNPNLLELKINTETEQFIVLSEIYYPDGWRAFIDDKELEIHQVNHLLRGIKIPAGDFTLSVRFEPSTYNTGLALSRIGNLFVLMLLLFPLVRKYLLKSTVSKLDTDI